MARSLSLAFVLLAVLLVAAIPVSHERAIESSTAAQSESHYEPEPHFRPDPRPHDKPEPEPEPEPEPRPDPRPEPGPKPRPHPAPQPKLPRTYLQDITISTGERLVPPFHPFHYDYAVNTSGAAISVRPVLADDEDHESFTIEVNDDVVSNNTDSPKYELSGTSRPEIIHVKVWAPDFRPSTYVIVVTSVPAPKHHKGNSTVWTIVWVVLVVAIVAILGALFYRATQRARAEGRPWPWSKEPASGAYGTLPGQEAEGARRT